MSRTVQAINAALRELAGRYAAGTLSAAEYRQRRRELICELSGESVPQVDDGAAEEHTQPNLPALSDTEMRAAVALASQQVAAINEQRRRGLSVGQRRGLVVALLLLALAGAALVSGFVLR